MESIELNKIIHFFKDYEIKLNRADFLFTENEEPKELIKEFINGAIEELEYSKKFIRYKDDGNEVNYNSDLEAFKKNINNYKNCFIGERISIRYPKRKGVILAYLICCFNALQCEQKEDIIQGIIEYLNKKIFRVENKNTYLKRLKNNQREKFSNTLKVFDDISNQWIEHCKNNKNISFEQLKKTFKYKS